MRPMILAIVSLVLTLPILLVGFIWIFQERIAFQPPHPPFPEGAGAERITYVAIDGQPLVAYIVGQPATSKGLLLCFHGNADLAVRAISWAEQVVRISGFAVMLAEYRGYMGLGGRSTYSSSRLDSDAAYAYARNQLRASPERIAFYGHSLGSAVAAELATRSPPRTLILESPFTSARAMAKIIGWHLAEVTWSVIARFHFDTAAWVASINAPVWVAHGVRDRIIPSTMGEQVFAAAKVKGELLLVPNASHNDVASVGGADYWHWIRSALDD
jgi:pimeloyl-ACP methyl ester carboxylesterase